MSLLGKVGNFLKKTVKTVAPVAIGYATGGLGGAAIAALGGGGGGRSSPRPSPSLPQMAGFGPIIPSQPFRPPSFQQPRSLPGAGVRPSTRITPYAPLAVEPGGSSSRAMVVHGPRKKYKRINPLNVRAARRAIRRIKAVRKITHEIERQLPHRKAAASCAPKRRKC